MWQKLTIENTLNYDGCGLYFFEKIDNKIILKEHLGHEMELEDYENIKNFNNLCRVSCWEIQFYNEKLEDWE